MFLIFFYRISNNLYNKHQKYQDAKETPDLNFINHSVTRWGSTHDLMGRFLLKHDIYNLLMDEKVGATDNTIYHMSDLDIKYIELLHEMVARFVIPTKELSSKR